MKNKKVQSGICRVLALVILTLINCNYSKAASIGMPMTQAMIDQQVANALGEISTALQTHVLGDENFTRSVVNQVSNAFGGRYNVVVINASNGRTHRLRGLVKGRNGQNYYREANLLNRIYHIYVFKSGRFVNEGDGGYINWAFTNSYCNRNDKVLNFTTPPAH